MTPPAFNRRLLLIGDFALTGDVLRDYETHTAQNHVDGLKHLKSAVAQAQPYALALVDLDMAADANVGRLWEIDPELQVVACINQCSNAREQIGEACGQSHNLVLLKKPFDDAEIQQLAYAMTEKWRMMHDLRHAVAGLEQSNQQLQHEVAERRRAEDRMRHSALHDSLTELPNRALLMERLERCIARGKRHPDYMYAVLFLDVDDFKVINDSLGHQTGDELLRQIAQRLPSTLRLLDSASRPSEDTMARFGGDEFVVLLDGIRQAEDAHRVAARIAQSLGEPFEIDGRHVTATVSVGIAVGGSNYDEPGDILRDADTALYHVKGENKGKVRIFSEEMHARAVARMEMEHDLRLAIERNQFDLKYQPIVSLESGRIECFEALLRWNHPQRGPIAPNQFVHVAEQCGAIVPIGQWVLREACRRAADWRDHVPDQYPFSVSVNMSVRQLADKEVLNQIDDILAETNLDPACLNLEITESMMLGDEKTTAWLLDECRRRGIAVHMDDFGTGYSSLSVLHMLPIDAIKLDRSFVRNMSVDGKHAATVQAVVMLARNRGFKVIAEGVERPEHLAQLQALDCDLAQGYYFSKPVDDVTASHLLNTSGNWRRSA